MIPFQKFATRQEAQAEADWFSSIGIPVEVDRLVTGYSDDPETDEIIQQGIARHPFGIFVEEKSYPELHRRLFEAKYEYEHSVTRIHWKNQDEAKFKRELFLYAASGGVMRIMEPITEFFVRLGNGTGNPGIVLNSAGEIIYKDGVPKQPSRVRGTFWRWTMRWEETGDADLIEPAPAPPPDAQPPTQLSAEQIIEIAQNYVPIGGSADFLVVFPQGARIKCSIEKRSNQVPESYISVSSGKTPPVRFESIAQVKDFGFVPVVPICLGAEYEVVSGRRH